MTESDMIRNIQEAQEEEGTLVGTFSDISGFIGMFIIYIGLFRLPLPNEQANGLVTLLFGAVLFITGLYGPPLAAALHARGKKYIINYVFYGSKMVRRDMELIGDPLVVARLTEKDEIEFVKPIDDSDYEIVIRGLGVDYLTDKDVDKKIEEALKERYNKAKAKMEKGSRFKRPDFGIMRRYRKWREKEHATSTEDLDASGDDLPLPFSPLKQEEESK